MLLPLSRKTKEGKSWYPVRLKRHYIGTGERLIIEIERTQQLDQPHVFQSGKVVNVFCNARNTPEKEHEGGVINYVRDNTMVITLNSDDLPDWIDDALLGVDVMFDEMTYREMEFALKEVIKADKSRIADLREILLGYQLPLTNSRLPVSNNQQLTTSLNGSQLEALNNIVHSEDIAIIHGPPGTGKTTTLVEAIVQTVKDEKQVLVCAPSNAAVDLMVDKLSEAGLNVLRIGHPARVTEQSLSKTLDSRIAMHVHFRELRTMRRRMEQLREMAYKYKRDFGYSERQQRKLLLQEAKALKADADVLEFYIINDLLQNSEVIASTLVGASHPTLRGKRYKSVFIDEAGQALEPACWIPILRAERVILAGDHHQLPPTVKSFEAAKAGLSKTLFEKCIQRHPQTAVMLQTQYRMHEDIMRFSANYFYNNELIAHESVRTGLLEPGISPVDFIDTAGCGFTEAQDPETLSRFNDEEARLLIRQVEKLILHFGVENWNFSIGIITPYSAQVERLIKLAESSDELSTLASFITINTVDAFQGQERDFIAISLVRSNEKSEVGFLGDIRRVNVAMTRAKKKLMIIGDSATLGAHPFYLGLLEYVQTKGFYKSAWEIM
ncbi:MAG: AAA family ATPase [Cyclobacteriaceae bacterium]|nr:AAA family ATPase [Cyclobacteriaceae bacterium]UYN88597.1 MAG: AAA family ATPase [Cyclobacteriaceae bacterium]